MSSSRQTSLKSERSAKLTIWLADRSSRNKSMLDKVCRWLVVRETTPSPDDDFMRDDFVDNDLGFDPDELDRYQRGEDIEPLNR
ncbi:MAG: hypothetical protein AAF699_15750 [Pseudomonadota bacterium]